MYTSGWRAFASTVADGLDLNSCHDPGSGKSLCLGKIAPIFLSVAGRQNWPLAEKYSYFPTAF